MTEWCWATEVLVIIKILPKEDLSLLDDSASKVTFQKTWRPEFETWFYMVEELTSTSCPLTFTWHPGIYTASNKQTYQKVFNNSNSCLNGYVKYIISFKPYHSLWHTNFRQYAKHWLSNLTTSRVSISFWCRPFLSFFLLPSFLY